MYLPDLPSEWEPVDDELAEFLKPDEHGLLSEEQTGVIDNIVANRWFLVANSLAWRCKRCRSGLISPHSIPGDIHPEITYACVPRPFNGLNEVLMFFREQAGQEETSFDSFTMRLGENIKPITANKASEYYLAIQMKTGRDLAWNDFRARYLRRYKSYLRSLGWSVDDVTQEQWKLVVNAARQAYDQTERG